MVDDDAEQQALMRAILEPLGFSMLSARDGPTCLALIEDVAPDLFVLDISMPGHERLGPSPGCCAGRGPRHADPHDVGQSRGNCRRPWRNRTGASRVAAEPRPRRTTAPPPHDAVLPKPFDLARLLDLIEALLALTWIQGTEPAGDRDVKPRGVTDPAPGAVAELLRLGAIGYVRGIEAKLAELAADPDQAALVATLRRHIERFDFDAYTAVLDIVAGRAGRSAGEGRLAVASEADPKP